MLSYWSRRAAGLFGASIVREVPYHSKGAGPKKPIKKGNGNSGPKKARRKRKGHARQLNIFEGRWGGAREGSGPKPKPGAGVPHDRRERFKNKPVHVTMSVVADRNGLRNKLESAAVREAFEAGKEKAGFSLVHYSIQHDHLHLIVEAVSEVALSVGMKALGIRLARALNRVWERKGRAFADRYHATIIEAPRHARNAVRYVLQNGRKHGSFNGVGPDPLSSGLAYGGWSDRSPELAMPDSSIVEARHYFFTEGWRRHCAPIGTWEVPPCASHPGALATLRKSERRRRRAA